ncbi:hypothetical protein FN846DRAFT_13118 [Sphaerosporella brunnea]|uniref:Uncharacterized protein n=1 Tax=Sphaerosporella brunnea TaxID=1250544 RepID=A0A5J5EV20_9PEZI|nr:hypothetical protein FN846DRAFT_13118 [Sphaerosporella brunnea]
MSLRKALQIILQLAVVSLFSTAVSAVPVTSIKVLSQSNLDNQSKQNQIIAIACGTIGCVTVLCTILYGCFRLFKAYYKTKVMALVVRRSRTMSFTITRPIPQRSRTMDLFRRPSLVTLDPHQERDQAARQPFLSPISPRLPSTNEEDKPLVHEPASKKPPTPLSPAFSPDLERGRMHNS